MPLVRALICVRLAVTDIALEARGYAPENHNLVSFGGAGGRTYLGSPFLLPPSNLVQNTHARSPKS